MDQDPVRLSLVENSPTDAEFHANLEMYADGAPLEYIFEKIVMRNQEFHIDRRVYIPNGKSSSIIDLIVDLLPQDGVAVDVGAGCGWIGILTKKLRPDATVILTDLEAGALEVAKRNSQLHDVEVEFIRSHLLKKIELSSSPDLIVSNLSLANKKHLKQSKLDDQYEYLPTSKVVSETLTLSIYKDLIDNILQLGFFPKFILGVGTVENNIVEQALMFDRYSTEVIRKNDVGFALLRRT